MRFILQGKLRRRSVGRAWRHGGGTALGRRAVSSGAVVFVRMKRGSGGNWVRVGKLPQASMPPTPPPDRQTIPLFSTFFVSTGRRHQTGASPTP
jgi:hypothetical protein